MNVKKLCMDLSYCDKETEVIDLLRNADYWDDPNAWKYYGGHENNFATIGNQQSKPETALIEKIVNSVDAVLMAQCLVQACNPESACAPRSISDALLQYYGIRDGKLSNITTSERSVLAENICLVATGAKSNPCYSIIDKGEGQLPEKMPDTILSIGKSNKLRIPFVQGKFNMGGTGVFQFCGKNNLHLIISKRHPEIAIRENRDSPNMWGFTIIRREDPSRGVKSSVYRYLAPNGRILSFDSNGLNLLPGEYPKPYERTLEWGTFIKLYEYQMTRLKTNIVFDLYNRLSLLMPAIALPVRFYERRRGYSGHTLETTLSGLTVRLDEDKRDNLENGFPDSSTLSVQAQRMKVSIFAFKRGQSEKYSKDEGIIFTINGQTHGHLSKSFFSKKAVRMGYLSDSILVLVDCSEFDGRAREDLFMNSRDRLRSGELRSRIERVLEDMLKNHQGLKDLRERRIREDVENKLEDSKPLAEVIDSILKKSPTLSKLFIQGVRLQYPFKLKKVKAKDDFVGKRFPSHFKLTREYPESFPKKCPINVKLRVSYTTDAENDYFNRDCDPGSFSLTLNGDDTSDFSLSLWNGTAILTVTIPPSTQAGGILHFTSSVTDVSRVDPYAEEFFVEVVEPVEKVSGKQKKKRQPPSTEDGDDTEGTSYLDLPNVIEVRREEWERHGFDTETALVVKDSGEEGFIFFVNMDNVHLRTEQKASPTIDPKLLDARYKYGMVLIGIALLKELTGPNGKSDSSEDDELDIYKQITRVTRIISPVLLPMIDGLGDLQLEEMSKAYEDE